MKPLLIVDGYNIIGAWPEANRAGWPLDECRDRLIRQMENYAGYAGVEVVIVFDGYLSDRWERTEETRGSVTVVYTMHAETADSYIERRAAGVPRYRSVTVATSDGLEQSQVLSTGAIRLTARELWREMRQLQQEGLGHGTAHQPGKQSLSQRLPEDVRSRLERLRRGEDD